MAKEKNPYAEPEDENTPLPGMFKEFFAWERTKELERRKLLSEDVQEQLKEADVALAARMNS